MIEESLKMTSRTNENVEKCPLLLYLFHLILIPVSGYTHTYAPLIFKINSDNITCHFVCQNFEEVTINFSFFADFP